MVPEPAAAAAGTCSKRKFSGPPPWEWGSAICVFISPRVIRYTLKSGKPLLQKMAELLDGKIWACGNRNKPVLC